MNLHRRYDWKPCDLCRGYTLRDLKGVAWCTRCRHVVAKIMEKEMKDSNKLTVESLRSPSWESNLVYGTLARMREDGIDTDTVYEETKITGEIDLRIVINGHEFPATAFVERWRREFDYQVAKEARKLVTEDSKLSNLMERVHGLLDSIERELREEARKAFPHADLDLE